MTYTKEELTNMLEAMQKSSDMFYAVAVSIGNHTWIEFTGFMNEYIKICRESLAKGQDFTESSVHTGKPLFQMEYFHAEYLGEKFGCIFSTAFNGNKELIKAFNRTAFGTDVG